MSLPIEHYTMANFPDRFQDHPSFPELQRLIQSITSHSSMKLIEEHVTLNMIRASLAFTVCFYGNLIACLKFIVGTQLGRHPFAVEPNGTLLHLFLALADGELATKNIPTKNNSFTPHYVAMLEAAEDAGIETFAIEELVLQLRTARGPLSNTLNGFHPALIDYMLYSEQCTRKFEDAFATIALRELTLSTNFSIIERHLPTKPQFDRYRKFLQTHIEVDSGEHAQLMSEALLEVDDIGQSISTMINFYKRRQLVYEACLDPIALF